MKQLFSLAVSVLSIVVLASLILKLDSFPVFELGVLVVLVILFLASFATAKNRMIMLILFALSFLNAVFLYLSSPAYRTNDLNLIGMMGVIGFFFELGRAEVIKIPVKERIRLMREWGMQKLQPISVEEEVEADRELKQELKVSKKLRDIEKLGESAKEFEKEIKKDKLKLKAKKSVRKKNK